MGATAAEVAPEERPQYANKLELMLTLVGYAVGLGNIWRFPYLAYAHGGGAFLVPYFLALFLLGLPLFKLELGLGQIFRQGTLGIWCRLGLPRLRGVGAGAAVCAFLVSLYYNVVIAWTLYYLGRTAGSLFMGGDLPWTALGSDGRGECPESTLIVRAEAANSPFLIDAVTGLFNKTHAADFWCPEHGVPDLTVSPPAGYVHISTRPRTCPGEAALHFWHSEALQQSSGMDELGGIHLGMFAAYTAAWLLVYFCVFNGIRTSGKVVYVTATLPYVALVVFFFRAVTLPNAGQGVHFFLTPDLSHLLNGKVWMRAVTQIFYSLGVAFGSLTAFASYGSKHNNFPRDATTVSFINCGTSIFAGFVVFPILGYLAHELSEVNPCIRDDDLSGLSSVGLSGTGLAFVAFPIAIAHMPGGFFWALLFFVMLLCLGIDSEFATVESFITVLTDAGIGSALRRPVLAGVVCLVSYLLGLIFVTRGGIYWFDLFDTYSCAIAPFFVAAIECIGLLWTNPSTWDSFRQRTAEWTGVQLGKTCYVNWKFVCPALLIAMIALSLETWDMMGARESKPFPEGQGYLPEWSIWAGWVLALLPILTAIQFLFLRVPADLAKSGADADGRDVADAKPACAVQGASTSDAADVERDSECSAEAVASTGACVQEFGEA